MICMYTFMFNIYNNSYRKLHAFISWTYTNTYAYSYIKVPVGTTQVHYTEVPVGTTGLILILQDLYLFGSPVGVTELTRIQKYP